MKYNIKDESYFINLIFQFLQSRYTFNGIIPVDSNVCNYGFNSKFLVIQLNPLLRQ